MSHIRRPQRLPKCSLLRPGNTILDGWADTGLDNNLFVEVRSSSTKYVPALDPLPRIILFLGSRKYLLRTLYHDLLNVAKNDASDTGSGGDELIELPQPTTGSAKSGHEPRGHFHSILARTVFSVCFEESVVLFTLLMFQGLDILDARYSPSVQIGWTFCLN